MKKEHGGINKDNLGVEKKQKEKETQMDDLVT